ncbi:MAG: hypothetical protein ACOH1I_00160 [Gallionellaceae bacterium]|jgi:hypothetical protein
MEERDNKTIICSVLFLDIVEYSQKNVSGQISLKEGFNVFLSTALSEIPVTDRIILDTGDGAAISFLGDIEDALKVGLSMRHSLLTAGVYMDTPLMVRMGINLGPVRLVKDINNQPNIVGDGINVAQRVMGFADVGQLLVSRSYYDAVSRISQEYAGMFHYQGSRTDKHVREHEVYAIGYPGEFTLVSKDLTNKEKLIQTLGEIHAEFARLAALMVDSFQAASRKQKILYISVPLMLLILVGSGLVVTNRGALVPEKQVVVRYYPDAEQSSSPSERILTVKSADIVETDAAKQGKETDTPKLSKNNAKPSIARVRTLEQTTGMTAVMKLVVLPWGEVYLDGRMQGISPPLLELQVAPGKHEIEIRNTKFPVYKHTIQAKAGEKITIKHTFSN